jgi:hypothetical protein
MYKDKDRREGRQGYRLKEVGKYNMNIGDLIKRIKEKDAEFAFVL